MTDKGKAKGKGRPPMDGARKVQKKIGLAPARWVWLDDEYGSYIRGIEALIENAMNRQQIGIAPPVSKFGRGTGVGGGGTAGKGKGK